MGTYDTIGGYPRNPDMEEEPCDVCGKYADECECGFCDECGSPLIKTEDEDFEYYKCDVCGETDFVVSKKLMKEAIAKNRGVES